MKKHMSALFLKNTSVDDAVERWFCGWDEETDVSKVISLKEQNKIIAEFVVIEDGKNYKVYRQS